MGTQGTGRKRSTKKERSTAEDDALNLIAREAEARLAAKRAARAEAREIRMKELERQQKEIFQVQKKYYGLSPKLDDRVDSKWGDIEQWMEDSERYSRPSQIHTLSDDDERMSVGSRGSVRSDLDAAYGGGGSSSHSHKKSKKKKKHKHKDRDRNGYNDDDYSVLSSRSSRLSDDSRLSRSSRLDLQPASYASSDLYSLNDLSSSRNPGSAYNGYQSSLYEDSLCSGSRRVTGSSSHPLEYGSYRTSGSRASSRASSARASPVDNCGSVASFLRSAASSSGLPRDLDDVTIPDFPDVEDRDYLEKGSRAGSALTAATLTSLGGSSSRRGSGETAITVDAETSLREIKEIHELKDQIQDVESKYTQNLKEVKETLAEVEEKYRKAMVSNAQLDNEKNNLMYQVDTLKDSLMELEELLSESRREFEEKVKEYEREKHAHGVLQFQYNELKETLKQSEELLNEIRQLRMKQDGFVREISDLQETVEWKDKKIGALERQKEYTDAIRIERDELREEVVKLKDILKKHGIVLGPDLNINGDIGETETEGTPGGDSAPQPAQESQTSPTEGNSMLGSAEETLLRSRGEEEVDPEEREEMFEEGQENHVTSDRLCNDADAVTVQTSGKEPPTEERMTLVHREEVDGPSKDVHIDSNADDETDGSPELQENSTNPEESIIGAEDHVGGDLVEPSNQDKQETRTKSRDDASSDDSKETSNNLLEQQGSRQQNIEESQLGNTEEEESKNTERSVQDVEGVENKPDEANQEAENAEGDNDEAEETSCKPQPQGATSSGKKKKKKKRGKKKGGSTEDKQKQKDVKEDNGTDQGNGKTEEAIESTAKDGGSTYKPHANAAEGSKMGQVMKEPERRDTVEADAEEQAKPTEIISHVETVKESHLDQSIPEQVTQEISAEEHVEPNEIASHTEALKESHLDEVINEEEQKIAVDVSAVETTETVCLVENTMESDVDQNITEPVKQEEDAMGHLAPNETFSNMETHKESHMDQVMNEQEQKNAVDVSAVDTTETFYQVKTTMESEVDQSITDPGKQEDAADCLEPNQTSSDPKALKESHMDEVINEEEQKNTVDASVVEEAETFSQTTIKSEVDQSFAEPVKQEDAAEDPLEPNETSSNTESLKESHLDQATNEEEHSKAVEVSAVETMETSHNEPLQESELDLNEKDSADTIKKSAVEPSGTLSNFENLEPKVDDIEEDHGDKLNLDSETAEVIDVMAPTTFSTPETVTQSRIDPDVEEQDTEKSAESKDEGSRPYAEVDISAAEKVVIEMSSDSKSTDNLEEESSENKNDTCASADGGSEKATMDSLDEVKSECMSDNTENISDPAKNIEDTVDKPANDSAVIESPSDSLSEPPTADDPTPGDGSVRVPDETVDDHEGLEPETQETNAKSSSETELTDTIETVSSPVDPTPEILVTEQSCDGKGSVSAKDQESEQLNDPRKDKTEDPSQLSQQDEEEDDEAIGDDDEEGQSFDFDDMDLDEAEETLNQNSGLEDIEEGVEVTVDESCVGEKNQSTPSGTATTEEDRSSADECNEADTSHISKVETDASPQTKGDADETEGKVQKDAARENAGAAGELGDEAKPEEPPNFGEIVAAESSGGAENVQPAAPVEEAVEAVELQGKDQAPSKSTDQVSGGKAAPAPSKDAKKNGKKSKEIRLRKLVDEREKMIEQVKKLKAQLEQKTQRNGNDSGSSPDGELLENGNDPSLLELQRDSNRQISDMKFKLVKAEQEVTALEQNVSRLEGQVTRYKSAAENSEKVEDDLKAEKRKLQRELRSALDKIDELESNNSHLNKRLEKMKSSRGMATP